MSDERTSVCGSGYPLEAKRRTLLALAESLGPKFAERAARYDREARLPFENYADLKEAWHRLASPESYARDHANELTLFDFYPDTSGSNPNFHATRSSTAPSFPASKRNASPAFG